MNDENVINPDTESEELEGKTEKPADDFNVEEVSSSSPLKIDKIEPPAPGTLGEAPVVSSEEDEAISKPLAEEAKSPVFKELAEPKLPVLSHEHRAYLQMQSPSRIFFYWSIKDDSFETLYKALGNRAQNYGLAVKLVNLTSNTEQISPVEASGSWWFNAEPDSSYRAEIGFYTPNRPFIRLVFSNTLQTPRSAPSLNQDYSEYFAATPAQFAEVLDLAGFTQDAFDVYLAGDYPEFADQATQLAFAQLTGKEEVDFSGISLYELRYVLFALASGATLAELRERISGALFAFLAALANESPEALNEEKVILALEEFFGFSPLAEEGDEEEVYSLPTVFGASLINFPKALRNRNISFSPSKRRLLDSRLSPFGSHSVGLKN